MSKILSVYRKTPDLDEEIREKSKEDLEEIVKQQKVFIKTQSGIIANLKRRLSKEQAIIITKDMSLVESILSDRAKMKKIVIETITYESDISTKIRFYSAIVEYEKTSKIIEKKMMGRKLVSLFVQNGSMFQITSLPINKVHELLNGKIEVLSQVKYDLLLELSLNVEFMKLVKKY